MKAVFPFLTCLCTALIVSSAVGTAQTPARQGGAGPGETPAGVTPPDGYVIGADDLLAIRFWGDERLSADVVVRSDGKISLPLLNDVQAAGLAPEEFKARLEKATAELYKDPLVATVIVTEIRSRKVYVIGEGIARSGVLPLNSEKTVLQALAESGGLVEYADKNGIFVIRNEGGKEVRHRFRYDDVMRGLNMRQNILLKPGDTIVVP